MQMGKPCMTRAELLEKDIFGAFSDYYTVKEAREDGVLPKDYWDVVPETCTCGAEIIMNFTLTSVMCCNPRCHVKLGYNLEKVYRNFGVMGIGPSTCLELSEKCAEKTECNSHLEFLAYTYFDLPHTLHGVRGQDIETANAKIRSEVLPFGIAVSKLGIPSWGSDAVKYLGQYDDCVQWIEDVKSYGSWVEYFDRKLCVYDPVKRFYLYEYAKDIAYAYTNVFSMYVLKPLHEIPITLSGSLNVNGYRITKSAYIDMLNKMAPMSNGRKVVQFVNNAAVASNLYVISDEMHTKARAAKQRELATGKKILYKSGEFLEYVKTIFAQMVGEQNE